MTAGWWAGTGGLTDTTCTRSCAASCGAAPPRATGRRSRSGCAPTSSRCRQWMEEVERLEDLTPAIELYVSLIRLGRFDEAFKVFMAPAADCNLLSAQRLAAAGGAS